MKLEEVDKHVGQVESTLEATLLLAEKDLTTHCAFYLLRIIMYGIPAAALKVGVWWEDTWGGSQLG